MASRARSVEGHHASAVSLRRPGAGSGRCAHAQGPASHLPAAECSLKSGVRAACACAAGIRTHLSCQRCSSWLRIWCSRGTATGGCLLMTLCRAAISRCGYPLSARQGALLYSVVVRGMQQPGQLAAYDCWVQQDDLMCPIDLPDLPCCCALAPYSWQQQLRSSIGITTCCTPSSKAESSNMAASTRCGFLCLAGW